MKKIITKTELSLLEYPFDDSLLTKSRLYKKSRSMFLENGGMFRPTLVSSARTLSSDILLSQTIEYSPMGSEWDWLRSDLADRKKKRQFEDLRMYLSSVFHEQNHRILWSILPNPPTNKDGIRRYLNFAESIVIMFDMALADELGPENSKMYFSSKVIYDPGTTVKSEMPKGNASRRKYRNYLHIVSYATYLLLEGYSKEDVHEIIESLNTDANSFRKRAIERAMRLNAGFVRQTNTRWQDLHWRKVGKALRKNSDGVLNLPKDPMNYNQNYLWTEKILIHFGL